MSITYTLRRRDSRSLTTTGSGVTFTVATGTRGPNLVSDATALGSLTDASADAPFLLAANAAGTFARKVTLGSVARSFMGATTQAAGRSAIDAEQAGTATAAIAAHVAAGDPHPQYALESALGTVATINLPGGTTVFLRGDGTWQTAGGGTVTSTDITDSTATGRAVLTAADVAAARSAIGAGVPLAVGGAVTSGTAGRVLYVGSGGVLAETEAIRVHVASGFLIIPAIYDGFASRNIYLNGNYVVTERSIRAEGWVAQPAQPVIEARGASGQTGPAIRMTDSGGSVLSEFKVNGAWQPPSMTDAAAPNNTVYYSTTAAKLVYKDSGGTVNPLY